MRGLSGPQELVASLPFGVRRREPYTVLEARVEVVHQLPGSIRRDAADEEQGVGEGESKNLVGRQEWPGVLLLAQVLPAEPPAAGEASLELGVRGLADEVTRSPSCPESP